MNEVTLNISPYPRPVITVIAWAAKLPVLFERSDERAYDFYRRRLGHAITCRARDLTVARIVASLLVAVAEELCTRGVPTSQREVSCRCGTNRESSLRCKAPPTLLAIACCEQHR